MPMRCVLAIRAPFHGCIRQRPARQIQRPRQFVGGQGAAHRTFQHLQLKRPDAAALETVKLEAGVVARLGECTVEWCRLRAGGYRGWAPKARLWGVRPDEVRE